MKKYVARISNKTRMETLHTTSDDAINKSAGELNRLSQDIWSQPELNYEEVFAHKRLTDFLEGTGFRVERHYKGIDTSFRACFGPETASPHVVIFCEYDALPEIGHGCGHNLIAEVGVAAGLGIKAAMELEGIDFGKVTILGSPAEEGGGGKIKLINLGALDDVDAAIMSHPTGFELPRPELLASQKLVVRYKGKASHASAFPWEGVNAIDAAVLCYQNLSCLRQQLKPLWQIHGVITHGGTKPNIIPEFTELEFYIRAPSARDLLKLKQKVKMCMEAAALATQCQVSIAEKGIPYLNLIQNETLSDIYVKHLRVMGIPESTYPAKMGASTDMGNVSYLVPSIHPCFNIASGVTNHTREFTVAAGGMAAQCRTLLEGKVLARLALDIFHSPRLLSKAKADFLKDIKANGGEAVDELLASGTHI